MCESLSTYKSVLSTSHKVGTGSKGKYFFLSFAAKTDCHKGTKAQSKKMLRIFLWPSGPGPQDPAVG